MSDFNFQRVSFHMELTPEEIKSLIEHDPYLAPYIKTGRSIPMSTVVLRELEKVTR